MNWSKYPNMEYMHVNSMGGCGCGCVGVWVCGCVGVWVWVCVLRWWKIIEYETRKKHWNRLSSLEKLYSLYHILAHSYCHMKDGRQLN